MIGMTRSVAVVLSRNMPTTSRITLTTSSSTTGSVLNDSNPRVNICGICSIAMIQPNSAATATMTRIADVLLSGLVGGVEQVLQVSVR